MEQNIIIGLQSISSPFLDVVFKTISHMVSWVGAIVVFLIIFFAFNKKYGFVYGLGFLATIGINYLIKIIVNRPRPFEANSVITNKLSTIGKSFPSGHMVSSTFIVLSVLFLFYILNKNGKFQIFSKKWFKSLCYLVGCFVIVLSAISRMYLGQHYITDILGGILVSALGFAISTFVYKRLEKKSN